MKPPCPVPDGPLVVQPDARAQAAQAPVLARLVRGGAYHRQQVAPSRLAPVALWLAYGAVPLALLAVLLTRGERIVPLHGVLLVTLAVILAAASLGVALVAGIEIWRYAGRGVLQLARAALVALAVMAYPAWLAVQALTLPVISEVSTDLSDPPVFSTLAHTLRARGGFRPGEATRAERAAQQAQWPLLRPLLLDMEPEEAFSTVLEAAKALKWTMTEETRPDDARGRGRIEAMVPSRLMRLPHDVTIRFRWTGAATRVDIRARSRFGRHDFGTNAALVQRLIAEISAPGE